ncbi:MAG TPA: FISUMP domain-containing protein [Fibrobacteraceae bacterium]|nr:FISUMP domain-containing protein [Fibrobacteraceae bacterium]
MKSTLALLPCLCAIALYSCGDDSTGSDDTSSSSNASSTSSSIYWNTDISYGTLTDIRDGQSYRTVQIAGLTWMAQNLNYSGDDGAGARAYTLGWCYGEDSSSHADAASCNTYGRAYDWATAMVFDDSCATSYCGEDSVNHQGVCPVGWHLPRLGEWVALIDSLGGLDTAGYFLKAASLWSYTNGVDTYGFAAIPAGQLSDNEWGFQGNYAYFWSATEYSYNAKNAKSLTFFGIDGSIMATSDYKVDALNVRCVEDVDD